MSGMVLYHCVRTALLLIFFFFNDTATTEIYTLSLHDALPIFAGRSCVRNGGDAPLFAVVRLLGTEFFSQPLSFAQDRKSTRLNSSHGYISYAVFCLKKKHNGTTSTASSILPVSTSRTQQETSS